MKEKIRQLINKGNIAIAMRVYGYQNVKEEYERMLEEQINYSIFKSLTKRMEELLRIE